MSLKKSELSFMDGFLGAPSDKRVCNKQKKFDWDKASLIIKNKVIDHPDLVAEAGLQGDWEYTGGKIFEKGFPTNNDYTYLSSNWATPSLILSYNGYEQEEIECYTEDIESRFGAKSKWDEISLGLLGIKLQ